MINKILITIVLSVGVVSSTLGGPLLNPTIAGGLNTSISNIVNSTNIYNAGGITNGQSIVNISGVFNGQYRGGNPVRWFGFSDSTIQNLRVNGWLSQGGYSNQWSTGGLTNGYLYYVGTYNANNTSYVDVFTNILALRNGQFASVDLAASIPGQRGADIWGAFNGSNYVSLLSQEANFNADQVNGFTYNSGGSNSTLLHGDPLPLTWWPSSTNDIYAIHQGVYYTNINNGPVSITTTGTSYTTFMMIGTPSFATTTKVTLPYRAGQGSVTKYAPPYSSACDSFNLTGNIPSGAWALSNAPASNGIPSGAVVQWGNNDITVLTTNSVALWNNQVRFGLALKSMGYSPVILVSMYVNPAFSGDRGTAVTNLAILERTQWFASGAFDGFYDWQQTNANLGNNLQASNYIDNVHSTTLYAGQNATNMWYALGYQNLIPNPLAAGPGGNRDASGLTNISFSSLATSVVRTNWASGVYWTNTTGTKVTVYTDESSVSAASGNTGFMLFYDPFGAHNWETNCNGVTIQVGLSIVGMTTQFRLSGAVAAGGVICWTNLSTVGTATLQNGYYSVP